MRVFEFALYVLSNSVGDLSVLDVTVNVGDKQVEIRTRFHVVTVRCRPHAVADRLR
jgi:hypothetical protein